jgi:membrane protease YdiL (CAAX protease family)
LKDAARLLAYFVAIIVIGALLAPPLNWTAQWLVAHGIFQFLSQFDFETFFHRALLVAAVLLLWPLLRSTRVRRLPDLDLRANSRWRQHLVAGFLLAIVPLLCCGAVLLALHIYQWRATVRWNAFGKIAAATVFVPLIEESLFRGLVLGILLRTGRTWLAILITSGLYSVVHFLKVPERTSEIVTWSSGFKSIAHSFWQFGSPVLVTAAFTTLFLIGWILADARLRTRSLWLPIGLHAGWIFGNGAFNRIARIAHRDISLLPWLGKNLLVGFVPLGVCLLTWLLVRLWLKYYGSAKT